MECHFLVDMYEDDDESNHDRLIRTGVRVKACMWIHCRISRTMSDSIHHQSTAEAATSSGVGDSESGRRTGSANTAIWTRHDQH